jgi:D-alanyl-D-alanine dipeptidase
LGFHVTDLDGYTQIGHGGAVYGFSTQLEALPERKLGVAAASSLDGTNGVVRRLADYALRLMLAAQDGKPLPSYRMTGPVPPERALELLGTYREVNGQRFTRITELDGDVLMQRGSFRFVLGAAADNGSIITDDEIDFGTEVKLQGSDRLIVGGTAYQRVADKPPADLPDFWKGLIGEYGWDHNTLYILEDNGRLYALIEWFYYYPLTKVDENTFAFPDYGLYHGEGLKFTRDADGVATEVVAAEVKFLRREVGTKDGETFRITPLKPIDELRAGALAASPPAEPGEFREADLVELVSLDPTIKLDIRYATTNNFTGAVFYKQRRAFMQKPAAQAVVRANKRLKERGLGLLIHDAYRPWHVTKMFWDATPDDLKDFVANPANGSRHNRGCAVDLTLYDLQSGQPIQMVAGYDEFSPRSFPLYPGGTSRQRWYRELLRRTMEAEGFTIYEYEWWHFDYQDWKNYRIGNVTFEDVLQTTAASRAKQVDPAVGFTIERTVAGRGFDGQSCWVHARAGAIPDGGGNGGPLVVMTTQKLLLSGSDVFYALNELQTGDLGSTWTKPQRRESFARKTIDARTEMTVCDFTPKWHAATGKLLGTGHTVWYRDNKVMKVRPRATAYSVFDVQTKEWSKWQELGLPDEPRFKNCGAGSVQRYDLPGGDILLPVYLKSPEKTQYSVSVLRCRFDGSELTYVEQGNELTIDVKRGLYEPSITKFGDLFFLTMRNDDHGYVATSQDGLQFDEPRRWTFDDGADLGNYNTQQHWVTHSDGLFLVYTRKGASNDHVFRHRAPLFIAQVDPQRVVIVRNTEQILVPERGARLGNFGVVDISPSESWVTATEWMQTWGPNYVMPVDNKYGADNSIHVAKLKWHKPNRLVRPRQPENR